MNKDLVKNIMKFEFNFCKINSGISVGQLNFGSVWFDFNFIN